MLKWVRFVGVKRHFRTAAGSHCHWQIVSHNVFQIPLSPWADQKNIIQQRDFFFFIFKSENQIFDKI
jgi:hypothetical protein